MGVKILGLDADAELANNWKVVAGYKDWELLKMVVYGWGQLSGYNF